MNPFRYQVTRAVQCGEMPYFLIFYEDRLERPNRCIMMCDHRSLRKLMINKRGFADPTEYGKIIGQCHNERSFEVFDAMLKTRFNLNIDNLDSFEVRFN